MRLLERIFGRKEIPKQTESQQLLEAFYRDPRGTYMHSSQQIVEYTGDYQSYLNSFDLKGYPVIQDQNEHQIQLSFLWRTPSNVPRSKRSSFKGFLKPYTLLFYDIFGEVQTPLIDIIEETQIAVGYKDYENLWNKRRKDLEELAASL